MNMYSLDGIRLGSWEWVGSSVNQKVPSSENVSYLFTFRYAHHISRLGVKVIVVVVVVVVVF